MLLLVSDRCCRRHAGGCPLIVVSAVVIGRSRAFLWQIVAVVAARKRTFDALLAVNHQVIKIENLPTGTIVPILFRVV